MKRLTIRRGRYTYVTNKDACTLNGYSRESVSHFCENVQCTSINDRSCPYLAVIDRLADYEDAVEMISQRYTAANGTEKSILGNVLKLLGEERI